MKLQLASDLHVEFQFDFAKTGCDFSRALLPKTDADVIVLAGDIWYSKYSVDYAAALAEQHDKPVIMVFGNHDYWGVSRAINKSIDVSIRENWALAEDLREKEGVQVHFLEEDSLVLNGVRFLGCTLWTDYSNGDLQVMAECKRQMNDTRAIAKKDGYPSALRQRHLESKAWLHRELQQSFEGKTVVITHHAPSPLSLQGFGEPVEPYQSVRTVTSIDCAYFSNQEPLMKSEHAPELWLHGHVHERKDYTVGNTRVLCNPYGYHGEAPVRDFDDELIINV